MLRVLSVAAVAAVACSGAAPVPAPPVAPAVVVADAAVASDAAALDQDLPRLAERSLALYRDVAQALTAAQDCAAATAKVRALAGEYRDVVAASAKVLQDGRAAELRAALDPHSETFDRSAQAIMTSPAMSKCSQDPGFAKAFDELVDAPPSGP
jgi:hypothetical protein